MVVAVVVLVLVCAHLGWDELAKMISPANYGAGNRQLRKFSLPTAAPSTHMTEIELITLPTSTDTAMMLSTSPSSQGPDVTKRSFQSSPSTPTTDYINPGCTMSDPRRLRDFKPIQTSTVYHHPSIVHYAWFGAKIELGFVYYVAMLSAYRFLKPEKIIIHSNVDIGHGKYWDLTQKWEGTSVEINKVAMVSDLGGKRVSYVQHQGDYRKLSQLLEHGGVMSDFDVIILNGTRIQEAQRKSECFVSNEGNVVNIGFLSCVRNSSFIRKWLEVYHRDYRPNLWVYNSGNVPTQILMDKSACHNMYLDNTICLRPNAGEARSWWLSSAYKVEWKGKTAAHHFLKGLHDANILNAKHSFGELLRYVCGTSYC